jgi:cellulose synthase/poly-beta-1,6-N-acetylglucosamine synthase-like glycosyltransferase
VWLSRIEKNFTERPSLDALSGPLRAFRKNTTYISLYTGIIGDAYGNVGMLATNNSAYKKSTLLHIGGFDETLITGEDVDLSWRLEDGNYNIQSDKKLIAYHKYRDTFKAFASQQFHYGIGRSLLIKRYPSEYTFFEKHITILSILAIFYTILAGISLFYSFRIFMVFLLFGVIFFILFVFGRRYSVLYKLLNSEGFIRTLFCLPLFIIIDYANLRGIFSKKVY